MSPRCAKRLTRSWMAWASPIPARVTLRFSAIAPARRRQRQRVTAGAVPAELRSHALVKLRARVEAQEAGPVLAGADQHYIPGLQLDVGGAVHGKHGLLPWLQGDLHRLTAGQNDGVLR